MVQQQAVEHGWSRNVLVLHIESSLYKRQGKALTNFQNTLPTPQSDLAQQLLKDSYNFDFLTLAKDAQEKEIETGLIEHIRKFLLELGVGFAFLGSQYPLEVSGKDYRLDLLFYHAKLHCYLVIDLKAGEFKPEYAGKMNFYLSALDDLLKQPLDSPSIGIITLQRSRPPNRRIRAPRLGEATWRCGISSSRTPAWRIQRQFANHRRNRGGT